MLLGMQAELHDTLRMFSPKLLHRPHLGNEGCVRVRREIASVRLLTLHLLGVEPVPSGKVIGSCPGRVFDLFNQFVEEVPEQCGIGAGPMWREADSFSRTDGSNGEPTLPNKKPD